MPIRSPLPAAIAALLCISLPAGGQDHTPDRARKTGTVAPTSVVVSFKEWTVPTPRSFPHDPLAAADGAIWYTGQMASTLGRLDPKTGAFKEYRTKTPDSGPHGLAADKVGNIWFTASFQGYIGKLDPKTGTPPMTRSGTQTMRTGISADLIRTPAMRASGLRLVA
jgi:streptogramin lyase